MWRGMIPLVFERFPPRPGDQAIRLGPNVRPLSEDVIGDVGRVLWILLGTVGIVLLIACANVANLFVVRAEGRRQELAVRAALGASRGRLARALLTESVTLGLAGGLLGLVLARAGIGAARLAGAVGIAARRRDWRDGPPPRRVAVHARASRSSRGCSSASRPFSSSARRA